MPRLTIVIPWMGPVSTFEDTLVSVLQHRPAECEVLVAHRDAYDDPYELREEVRLLHCPQAASLCDLQNYGLLHARSPIIHTLPSGVWAEEGWTDAALACFDDERVASVSPLVLSADRQRVVASGVAYRPGGGRLLCDAQRPVNQPYRWGRTIWGPTMMAGFYRRQAMIQVGGWSKHVGDGLADADLAASLRRHGGGTRCAASSRLTLAQNWPAPPSLGYRAGRAWHRLHRRHKAAAPWTAALTYPLQTLRSLRPGVGESWWGLPGHLVGRLAACFEAQPADEPIADPSDRRQPVWAADAPLAQPRRAA